MSVIFIFTPYLSGHKLMHMADDGWLLDNTKHGSVIDVI